MIVCEDKENKDYNCNTQNHLKTPNHKTPNNRTPNGDKSPTLFRKNRKELSDIKMKRIDRGEENCLTPKGRTTSKVTPTKSGIKTGRQDLTGKKEKDLSTRKKRPKKEVCLLE